MIQADADFPKEGPTVVQLGHMAISYARSRLELSIQDVSATVLLNNTEYSIKPTRPYIVL